MRTKPRTLGIGTVEHGTMRPEDLIPSFLWEAKHLRLTRRERQDVNDIEKRSDAEGYYEQENEDVDIDLERLFDILNDHTPDYCYFGSHPGDGSDYGCWPIEELLDDAHQGGYDGFVWRLRENEHPTEADIGKDYTHALAVNDHGNATLYRRAGNRWREVWGCV